MSIATAEKFTDQIVSLAETGIAAIDAALKRGYCTPAERRLLNSIEESKLPTCLCAFELAAEAAGKRVRDRRELVANVLSYKGLHVSNTGQRPAVYVYGGIGEGHGITAADFRSQLDKFNPNDTVELHVHSDGGDFDEAIAINSVIARRPGRVLGYVDGTAASAGTIILQNCATITMAAGANQMIHYVSVSNQKSWTETQLAKALKLIREANESLLRVYLPRWKKSRESLDQALENETYFNAVECVDVGLADYVSEAVRRAPYAAISSYRTEGEVKLAACANQSGVLNTRRAGLRLWKMAADDMRREIGL